MYICLSSERKIFGGEQMKLNRIKINQNSHNSNKRGTGSRPFPTGGQFPSPKQLAYVVPNPIASQEERTMYVVRLTLVFFQVFVVRNQIKYIHKLCMHLPWTLESRPAFQIDSALWNWRSLPSKQLRLVGCQDGYVVGWPYAGPDQRLIHKVHLHTSTQGGCR